METMLGYTFVFDRVRPGLAHSELFDLLLMDGGDGNQPTNESLGRVLKDIERRIRKNEVREDVNLRPLARTKHDERGCVWSETLFARLV